MPFPTAMTEADVRTYMVQRLSTVASVLGLTAQSEVIGTGAEEVDGFLTTGILGTTGIEGVRKIRALARWQAWLAAYASRDQFDIVAASGAKLTRSQMMRGIADALARCELEVMQYPEAAAILAGGGGGVAYAGVLTLAGSPYGVDEWGA